MNWHDSALALAGVLGATVALIHGVLTQRLMVTPFRELAGPHVSGTIRRLVPALLQFSAFNWFVGGLALLAAALWFGSEAKLAIGLLVGSSYLFAVVGNCWGTRGRHPGWMLYAVALALTVYGLWT